MVDWSFKMSIRVLITKSTYKTVNKDCKNEQATLVWIRVLVDFFN